MGRNRIIKDNFWNDEWVEDLDPIEKLLFIYLLTNEKKNLIGVYRISNKRIAFETGIDRDMIEKILKRLSDSGRIISISEYIIIVNNLKYQTPNPNMVKDMQKQVDDLPTDVAKAFGMVTKPFRTLLNYTLHYSTAEESAKPNFNKKKERDMQREVTGLINKRKSIGWGTPQYTKESERIVASNLINKASRSDIDYRKLIKLIDYYQNHRSDNDFFDSGVNNLFDLDKKFPTIKAECEKHMGKR